MTTFAALFLISELCFKPGMHNILSASQMWPAKTFNLAIKPKILLLLLLSLIKKHSVNVLKHINFGPCQKFVFGLQ